MMISAQVVEKSVDVTTDSPTQEHAHPDDPTSPTHDSWVQSIL